VFGKVSTHTSNGVAQQVQWKPGVVQLDTVRSQSKAKQGT
jgi:hypothetical protein